MIDKLKTIQFGLLEFIESNNSHYKRLKIDNLVDITSGWEAELYSFRMQYYEDNIFIDKDLVIRMFPGKNAARKLSHEFYIYTKLKEQNYPVPKIHFMTTESKFTGKPFLIMDLIKGGTLYEKMISSFEELLKSFTELFVSLHKLDWKPFVNDSFERGTSISISSIDNYLNFFERRIEYYELYYLMPILTWLRKTRKKILEEKLAIVHHDFHPYNIMLDEEGNPFVIDWTGAMVSDFRFDLGWTFLLAISCLNEDTRNAMLNSYQKMTNQQIEHIDFFEVAAILRRLSDILIIINKGSEEISLQEGVITILNEQIDDISKIPPYLFKLTRIKIPEINDIISNLRNK